MTHPLCPVPADVSRTSIALGEVSKDSFTSRPEGELHLHHVEKHHLLVQHLPVLDDSRGDGRCAAVPGIVGRLEQRSHSLGIGQHVGIQNRGCRLHKWKGNRRANSVAVHERGIRLAADTPELFTWTG